MVAVQVTKNMADFQKQMNLHLKIFILLFRGDNFCLFFGVKASKLLPLEY